jgi:putative transposase
MREVVNGIYYILRSGGSWRMMPHDLPAWQTVYGYFRPWRRIGRWEALNDALRESVREQAGRQAQPRAALIDRQSVKTTESGVERGFDAGKNVKGRKRHILVDVMGLLLVVLVHPLSTTRRSHFAALLACSCLSATASKSGELHPAEG